MKGDRLNMENSQANENSSSKNDETRNNEIRNDGTSYITYKQHNKNDKESTKFSPLEIVIEKKTNIINQKIEIILNTLNFRIKLIKIRIKSIIIKLIGLYKYLYINRRRLAKDLYLYIKNLPKYLYLKIKSLLKNLYLSIQNLSKYLYLKIKNLLKDLYLSIQNLPENQYLIKYVSKILYLKDLLVSSFAKERYKISRRIARFIVYFNRLNYLLKNFKQNFKGNIDADREFLGKVLKDFKQYFKENIDADRKFLGELKKNIQKSREDKALFKDTKQIFKKLLLKIKDLQLKELINKYFKETFYKTKQLSSIFVTLLKRKSYKIKNLSRKQKLEFVKSFSIQAKKQILIEYLKNFKPKFSIVQLLLSLKLEKQYIKFRTRLIVFFIKNKINFKDKQRYYFIELKKKLDYQLSNSKRIQHFMIKFNEAKLLAFNLRTNLENFIINVRYNHELAKEYAERILFVIVLYSLPLLILTKVFYTNILILAKAGDTRFDGLISEKHFNLLMSDKKVFAEYIPLKFVPRILQSTSIDFYIFLSYYTVFGTSKFMLNKELVYHGIICLAHLIVYASIGLIMSIIQNFTEFYTYIVGMWVRHFFATKFALFFKNKQLKQRASKVFLIKQALTEDPTAPFSEWNHYGICAMDKIVSRIPQSSETFFTAYLLTPISLYVLITLIYNCCYYIIYNKRPFIPFMTNFANRITPNVKKDE